MCGASAGCGGTPWGCLQQPFLQKVLIPGVWTSASPTPEARQQDLVAVSPQRTCSVQCEEPSVDPKTYCWNFQPLNTRSSFCLRGEAQGDAVPTQDSSGTARALDNGIMKISCSNKNEKPGTNVPLPRPLWAPLSHDRNAPAHPASRPHLLLGLGG